MSKKRVVVFGGSGFIGSHLVDNLLAHNYEVSVFVRPNFDPVNILHIVGQINIIKGDYFNEKDIERAIAGHDVLCHLISTTVPLTSISNPVYDIETNVIAAMKLFDKALELNIPKIVFASSGGTVYGIPETLPVKESHSLYPISIYGLSKVTIEKYLYLLNHLHGIDYKILRLSNPYGSRQNVKAGQGVIRIWLNKVLKDESIEIWGDGSIVRDYIYISDAVSAIRMIIESDTKEKIFNIGSGQGSSLLDIISVIEKQTGKSVNIKFMESRNFDVPTNILNIELAKRELNWEPKISLDNGVLETWEWLKTNSN